MMQKISPSLRVLLYLAFSGTYVLAMNNDCMEIQTLVDTDEKRSATRAAVLLRSYHSVLLFYDDDTAISYPLCTKVSIADKLKSNSECVMHHTGLNQLTSYNDYPHRYGLYPIASTFNTKHSMLYLARYHGSSSFLEQYKIEESFHRPKLNFSERFYGHKHIIPDIASYDNDTLISTSWDRTLKIWDLNTQLCFDTLSHESAIGDRLLVLPGLSSIVNTKDTSFALCDPRSLRISIMSADTGHNIRCITRAPNPYQFLTAGLGKAGIHLWDIRKQGPVQHFCLNHNDLYCNTNHDFSALSTAHFNDTPCIIGINFPGMICIWNALSTEPEPQARLSLPKYYSRYSDIGQLTDTSECIIPLGENSCIIPGNHYISLLHAHTK